MTHPALPAIIAQYLGAYEAMDVEALVGCLAEDVVFENISNHAGQMKIEGREKFREVAVQSTAAFSERRQEVKDVVGSGDASNGRWAVEILFQGTLATDMGEGMPAGTHFNLRGVSLISVANGKITQISDFS